MKKFLLFFVLSFLGFGIAAQNLCPTCHEGTHGEMIKNPSRMPVTQHWVGNGNNTLGSGGAVPSYDTENVCGLNYFTVSQEITTRATWQPGSGFPAVFPVVGCLGATIKAYLYWGVSYWGAVPVYTASITDPNSNTTTYPSTNIGTGPSKCWGETGTAAYRADITAAITVNGSYNVALNGPSTSSDDKDIDGMTLVYIYSEPANFSGSIVLWDGDYIAIGSALSETFSGFAPVCANANTASAFGCFGDMQNNIVPPTNTETFNGSTASFPNSFWNTDIVPTTASAAQNNVVFNTYTNNTNDCYSWILAGFYWQNNSCVVCNIPNALTLTLTSANPSCGNNNGFVTANVTGGVPPYTYLWSPGGQTTMTISGLSAGTYSCTVKDNTGCDSITDVVTLIMVNLNIAIAQTNILCNGQTNGSITYTVGGGSPPYTYTWTPNLTTTASASGLSAGTYTTVISDNNGCASTENVTITEPPLLTAPIITTGVICNGQANGSATATAGGGTPAYTYAWMPAGGNATAASGLSAGTYSLVLTDNNGCSITSTAAVTQPAVLAVTVTGPQTLCVGVPGTYTATVTGGTVPYTYSWVGLPSTTNTVQITPASSQTYTAVVTDANGCSATTTFSIILGPPLVVTVPNGTMCSGMSVVLCATVSGGTGGNIFTWQPGNLTGPCITVSPTSTTIYTLTVQDNCGSDTTANSQVLVNPSPVISFAADLNRGCSPLCVQFRNSTTVNGGIESYLWNFGNGDTTHSKTPIYCYSKSGSYAVTLTAVSDSGCSSTLNIQNMITVYTHPNASFTISPNPAIVISPTVQFTDQSTDQYGLAYWWWNFGETGDTTSNLQNPTHIYQDTGRYCIQEVIMDINGCTDTSINCLDVEPAFSLYIPSAFSPNGDGKNEIFRPVGQYIRNFEMYIFDRWGNQLFYTTDIVNGWNGSVKGGSAIAQEDTYIYKINLTDARNKQHSFTGNVTIIK